MADIAEWVRQASNDAIVSEVEILLGSARPHVEQALRLLGSYVYSVK